MLGTVLFDRVPNGMRLTVAGWALLPIAESIAAAIGGAGRAVRAAGGGHATGTVRLAVVVGTLADDALVRTLDAFRTRWSDVDIRIETGLSAMVSRGDLDLGLRYALTTTRLGCAIVADDPVVAIAAPGHPLAGRTRVTPSMARGQQWLVFESSTRPWDEP